LDYPFDFDNVELSSSFQLCTSLLGGVKGTQMFLL
jgi:hypothetical protein